MNRQRQWLALGLIATFLVAGTAHAAPQGAGTVWGAGYFPNVELTAHDGRKLRFFDDLVKDKVVAINFMYTHCPDVCSLETARMLEVHRLLADRAGKDVHFYSITIDPERDTPQVLDEYRQKWGIGAGWTFLTGAERDIVQIRRKLGVYREDESDLTEHNFNLVLGNQAMGRWVKRTPYENAHVLASQLGGWLHNWKMTAATGGNYAEAPDLRRISDGEMLFRTRCSSCHTIGQGDIMEVGARRVGPDLRDVTKTRAHDWLVRWLAEPDKMLAEQDPIALSLLARYDNLPMPNLRLTPREIGLLLGYIEDESQRLHVLEQAAQHGHDGHDHHGHTHHHEAHAQGGQGDAAGPQVQAGAAGH